MEHEIILDLLPLYHDGVCSEASRRAVEAHLEDCEACRRALEAMDAPLPEAEKEIPNDTAAVKKIAREWKKGRWKAWVRGAAIAAGLCAVFIAVVWGLTDFTIVQVPAEEYTVEAYQFSDGSVGVYWEFAEGKETWYALEWKDEADGRHWYLTRPILRNFLWTHHYRKDGGMRISEMSPIGAREAGVKAMYFGLGEESILLWSKEDVVDLPAASAADEAKYGGEPG